MGELRTFSRHVRWSEGEVQILWQLYPTSASRADLLAALPSRSISQIQNKANGLGIARPVHIGRGPDEVRKAKREFMATKRAANPEKARAYQRRFYHENRDRYRLKSKEYHRRRFFNRRATKLLNISAGQLASLWRKQRGLCGLTGERLTRDNAQVDHISPRSRGGTDDISNLRWVTKKVNYAKRELTDSEFLDLCRNVAEWIGIRIQQVDDLPEVGE